MFRNEFPMLGKKIHGNPFTYFDSAATALKPQDVINSISDFYAHDYATVNRGVYTSCKEATDTYYNVRKEVADFVGANHAEEIIFTGGTTASLNLLAKLLFQNCLKEGDEIILSEMEHHANIVPWQIEAKLKKVQIKVAPIDDNGDLDLEALKALITPKTKVLSLCHVSNALGTSNPIKEISHIAKENGLLFVLDAAQSAPHDILNVQDLGVDFLVFSGHKIYGPTGVGILYGRKDLLESLDPVYGGGDMIDSVSFEKTSFAGLPHKFEPGTPMIAQVIGMGAAIKFLKEKVSFSKLLAHDTELTAYLLDSLSQIEKVKILGNPKKRTAVVSFTVEGAHAMDVATMLDFSGIAIRSGHHCTQPLMRKLGIQASCRASIGLYNTKEEIDFLKSELQSIIKSF
jgi:cysteine desulfurase / selenocysteine lyase